MRTPVCDFLKQYEEADMARFHMPGHKGRLEAIPAAFDITEIKGADSLYEASGVLRESEENAGALYGTKATVYSASGSTLCIQTMLLLTTWPGDTVLCARNAHSSFYNALALFRLTPVWLLPESFDDTGVSGAVSPAAVERALSEHPEAAAVYITSPDYMGGVSDIAAIAKACQQAGVPLLVDNAHGAHRRFLPGEGGFSDRHPITLGASLCCDSAHKTLPVLTGGAYLHSRMDFSREQIKEAMSMVATTSPSYLILASLDRCNRYLQQRAREDFAALSARRQALVREAEEIGFFLPFPAGDCTKLTLDPRPLGGTGPELAAFLRERKIEPEYVGPSLVVLLMTPQNRQEDFARLTRALAEYPRKAPLPVGKADFSLPERVLTPAQAVFSPWEEIPAAGSAGRVCAQTKITCPPGVPVVCPGEKIPKSAEKLLQNSGIGTIKVVK